MSLENNRSSAPEAASRKQALAKDELRYREALALVRDAIIEGNSEIALEALDIAIKISEDLQI